MSIEFKPLMRPVYEMRSALVWGVASAWSAGLGIFFNIGPQAAAGLLGLSVTMAAWRGYKGNDLVKRKLSLVGKQVEIMPVGNLLAAEPMIGENLWLGRGWRWEPSHTQLAYELSKYDTKAIYPEPWVMKLLRINRTPGDERGLQWIHGLEPASNEVDILASLDSLKGHCAVIATTGAIKTRLCAMLVAQIVAKGDVVIAIDPKNDNGLEEVIKKACEAAGQADKFVYLHPGRASESVRLDVLKNWDRVSQVASRISMSLGIVKEDGFTGFCWQSIYRVTCGLKFIGSRVNIANLKRSMESRSTVEHLAHQMLKKFFEEEGEQFLDNVQQTMNVQAKDRKFKKGELETSIPELSAMIKVYLEQIPDDPGVARAQGVPHKNDDITGVIAIISTSQEWFAKMVNMILPMLTKLCTDDLLSLLSPDYEDIDDKRPIMDMKRIVEGGYVFLVGTDALSDMSVAKALSSMIIAEAAAVASEIYNHGLESDQGRPQRRIHIIAEEWGDSMCPPLVQLANKGRGAGVFIWGFGQTFSDLVDAFDGSVASAKRFMGNMNNIIAGSIQDVETSEMISERFGETAIQMMSETKMAGNKTEDTGLEFSTNNGRSLDPNKVVPVVHPDLLRKLPDLQFFALFNRTMAYKGRIPVVVM